MTTLLRHDQPCTLRLLTVDNRGRGAGVAPDRFAIGHHGRWSVTTGRLVVDECLLPPGNRRNLPQKPAANAAAASR